MPVTLIARCYYLNTNGTVRHEGDIFMGIASLNQDQQITKVVSCPETSAHTVYARLKATTPNDLNEANNTAYAPNPLAH